MGRSRRHPTRGAAFLLGGLLVALLFSCQQLDEWFGGDGGAMKAPVSATLEESPAGEPLAPLPKPDEQDDDAPAPERTLSGPMQDVYKFTDAQGVVNYVDSLDKVPERYRKQAHHPTGGWVTILPSSPIDDLLAQRKIDPRQYATKTPGKTRGGGGPVVLYSTGWCPHCTRARQYLKQRGVDFVEKDIEQGTENLTEMLSKSGGARGVPVIDVRGEVLRGFSQAALDRALAR
jgi:glutaredoxin-like YruB-family protein